MTTAALRQRSALAARAWRYARSPKGMLLLLLVPLALVASEASTQALLALAVAAAVAAMVDVALVWGAEDEVIFPTGAILTGLIVAMVLSPINSLPVVAVTSAVAITSKRVIRYRGANIFNPAALALVVSAVLLGSVQSWWGALPAFGPAGIAVLAVAGYVIANRVDKLPLVIAFLAAYGGLFVATAFVGNASVAEVFRAPDIHATLFFAVFMLDDPPTCPVRYRHQLMFGLVAAAVAYAAFMVFGVQYFLLAGALVANAWEAARRFAYARRRATA